MMTTIPASPKALDFVAGLAASKTLDPATALALFTRANDALFTKDEASELIDGLMALDDREVPEGVHTAPEGSPWAGEAIVVKRSKVGRLYSTKQADGEYLNGKGLLGLSTETLAAGVPAKVDPSTLTEGAVYVHADGRIVKVVRAKAGHFYGKVLLDGRWEYVGGALDGLTPEARITAEQAAAYGAQTSRCVFCSRTLTDGRSTEVGYGPQCASDNGLPWG